MQKINLNKLYHQENKHRIAKVIDLDQALFTKTDKND